MKVSKMKEILREGGTVDALGVKEIYLNKDGELALDISNQEVVISKGDEFTMIGIDEDVVVNKGIVDEEILTKYTELSSQSKRESYLVELDRDCLINQETLDALLNDEPDDDMADFLKLFSDSAAGKKELFSRLEERLNEHVERYLSFKINRFDKTIQMLKDKPDQDEAEAPIKP